MIKDTFQENPAEVLGNCQYFVCKSRSTNQNQKENCTEVEDHIWTKMSENQEDLRHSISEVG